MIVYYKLANILKERNMQWKDLCKAGISVNTPTKFSQNRSMNTDIIDKVCEFLQVQPYDIMEWVSLEDYEKMKRDNNNAEKAKIEQQIAELQAKLNAMQQLCLITQLNTATTSIFYTRKGCYFYTQNSTQRRE